MQQRQCCANRSSKIAPSTFLASTTSLGFGRVVPINLTWAFGGRCKIPLSCAFLASRSGSLNSPPNLAVAVMFSGTCNMTNRSSNAVITPRNFSVPFTFIGDSTMNYLVWVFFHGCNLYTHPLSQCPPRPNANHCCNW